MAVLPIRVYPDPVLRVRCAEVTEFDDGLRRLAEDMVETMHRAPGVGLAASQVGVEKRLAVVDVSVGEDPQTLRVLVNPRLVEKQGSDVDSEGCLSIPGLSDKVRRPLEITVEAQDLEGREVRLDLSEFEARAVCHEIDHLNGVLFVDHLRGLRRDRARRHLRRLKRNRPAAEPEAAVG